MKKEFIFLILYMVAMVICSSQAIADPYDRPKPKTDEVAIHYSGIEVPLNRILLVRKDNQYCTIKFTECWTEIDEEEMKKKAKYINQGGCFSSELKELCKKKFAIYKSFHQEDGTGNFTNNNVKVSEGKASWLPLRGPFRPFIYQQGDSYVKCGSFKLGWQYKTGVIFMPPNKDDGDYGFELAPTPWTEIKEVNINDPRVKWYRYDDKRERIFIPIDKLWKTK